MTEEPSYEELKKQVEQLHEITAGHRKSIEELKIYQNIISSTEDGIAFLDEDYRYVIVNAAYERFSGVSREEILGLTISEYLGKEVFEEHAKENFDRCLQGEVVNYQQWFDYPNMGRRFIDVTYFPYVDDSKRISGVIANTRDITEGQYFRSEQHMMNDLLNALHENTDKHELARRITLLMQEWSGCEAVAIRLQEGEDFPYFETRGFRPGFIAAENRIRTTDENGDFRRDDNGNPELECMCGAVINGRCSPSARFLTARGSFWTNSTSDFLARLAGDSPLTGARNHCNEAGYESLALVPLQAGSRQIGLLQFNDRRKGRFDERIIAQFERFAANLAIAFLQREADRYLRESEERYKYLVNNLPGTAYQFVLSRQGEQAFSFIGEGCRKLFGVSPEEVLADQAALFSKIPEEDIERIQKAILRSAAGMEQYDVEHRVIPETGQVIWIRAISTPRQLENLDIVWDGIAIDISERREVERILLQSYEDIKLRERIGKLFLTSNNGNLYADILKTLLNRFDSEFGYIGYMDEDGSLVCPSMTREIWDTCRVPEKTIRFFPKSWEGIWGESLKKQVSIMRNQGLQTPEGHLKVHNALIVPLLADGKLVGQIALANKTGGYFKEDKEQLESLAEFIAPVLKINLEKEKIDKKLRASVHKLEQTNIALSVVLEKGNEDSRKLSQTIRENFEKLVFPYFETVTLSHSKEDILTILDIIRKNTETSLSSLVPPYLASLLSFSPTEKKIADLVKAGKASKEIAGILRISPRSVFFHRNNMRKKLNIHNTGESLKAHLQQLDL